MDKLDRNIRFFGLEGQRLISQERVAVVGSGGLGEHVIQQATCLGVGELICIDHEDLDHTNRNRYVLAKANDPVPGMHKVDIAERAVREIDPTVRFTPGKTRLRSQTALDLLLRPTAIFGCLDNEGGRLILMELACAYRIPYFDLATDIPPTSALDFGGRFVLVDDQPGCLVCRDVLDLAEARADLETAATRADIKRIYGVDKRLLGHAGPSVVSLNGIIASLGITEFIMKVTGVRPPEHQLSYRGRTGIVSRAGTPAAAADCYYCQRIKGAGAAANVARYFAPE